MSRQARLDTPGTLHHVMIRGIEKRPIVDDGKDKKEFVLRMGTLSTEEKTTIYAWTLLTNHAHILLRSGPYGLSKFTIGRIEAMYYGGLAPMRRRPQRTIAAMFKKESL
jgi:hypothetical protein